LEKAAEREKQRNLIYEKKLQREVEAEKELFGETEAFITPGYAATDVHTQNFFASF